MSDLRAKLLNFKAGSVEKVEVDGETFYVRVMSGKELDDYQAENISAKHDGKKFRQEANLHNVRARLLVRCLCDENGVRLFKDNEADLLGGVSGVVLDKLYEAATKLNHLNQVEESEAEKNSRNGQLCSSGSV